MVFLTKPRIRKLRPSNVAMGKLWQPCNRKGKFLDNIAT
jgi:hypothetical protein